MFLTHICRAVLPVAVVARGIFGRTRTEVALLGVTVESAMGGAGCRSPGSLSPAGARGGGRGCRRHPGVGAVVVVDRSRSRSSWGRITHDLVVLRCPDDTRKEMKFNVCDDVGLRGFYCGVLEGRLSFVSEMCFFFFSFFYDFLVSGWVASGEEDAQKSVIG